MVILAEDTAIEDLDTADIGNETWVRLPRIRSDQHYLHATELLMKLASKCYRTTWIIDLSEQDSIPMTLGGVLLRFREYARSQGCDVRFSGIRDMAWHERRTHDCP
jgi:hypothetical protein